MPPWVLRLLALIVVTGFITWGLVITIQRLSGLILTLVMALFLSFAVEPGVGWLAHRGWKRGLAAAFILFMVASVVVILFGLMVPVIVSEVNQFIDALPGWLGHLSKTARDCCNVKIPTQSLQEQMGNARVDVTGYISGIAGNVLSAGASTVGVIFQLCTVGLFTFYLAANGPKIRRALCSLLAPERQERVLFAWNTSIDKTGGYFYSRLLLAVINGGLLFVVLILLDVPFALPLAIFSGLVSEFIPIVGTYVGVTIPVLVALANDPLDAVWLIIYATIYQQIENAWLSPKVSSHTMELNAGVAFAATIAGGNLGGFLGAFMALPVAAVVQSMIGEYAHHHDVLDSELTRLDEEHSSTDREQSRRTFRIGRRQQDR